MKKSMLELHRIDPDLEQYYGLSPDRPEHYRRRVSDIKSQRKRYCGGMTLEQFLELFRLQDKLCGICRQPPALGGRQRFHVDHDSNTDEIRGLLCQKCNRGLGYFDDSLERLKVSVEYLNKPPGKGLGHRYTRKG
jgi:hypothetical protein